MILGGDCPIAYEYMVAACIAEDEVMGLEHLSRKNLFNEQLCERQTTQPHASVTFAQQKPVILL